MLLSQITLISHEIGTFTFIFTNTIFIITYKLIFLQIYNNNNQVLKLREFISYYKELKKVEFFLKRETGLVKQFQEGIP